jgi:PTH1 family peptidyl-tRNA hydrolase
MKVIVGLGNPGRQYAGTRHNIGFEVIDEVARRWSLQLRPWKSVALVAVDTPRGAVLVQPQTFMNLSGEAVARIATFHKVEPSDVLVVVDEVQLPLGRIRLRRSGSAGGHNGLKSIIQHVGPEFPRLRIGVGRGDARWDLADHVLARFEPVERDVMSDAVVRAADAVELFVSDGMQSAMNRFNQVPGDGKTTPGEKDER